VANSAAHTHTTTAAASLPIVHHAFKNLTSIFEYV
jgi:hypothetical protein